MNILLLSTIEARQLPWGTRGATVVIVDRHGPPPAGARVDGRRPVAFYHLFDHIEANKERLIKGYLHRIDRFHDACKQLFDRRGLPIDNPVLFHFTSKRNDVFPTFLRHATLDLVEQITTEHPDARFRWQPSPTAPEEIPLSCGRKLGMILRAWHFFSLILLTRILLLFFGKGNTISSLKGIEALFFSQSIRHAIDGRGNVNTGPVFRRFGQHHRSAYGFSLLTDGVHEPATVRGIIRKIKRFSHLTETLFFLERVLGPGDLVAIARDLGGYSAALFALFGRRRAPWSVEDGFVFQAEVAETLGRLFSYAYLLRLSRALSTRLAGRLFVYYAFELNLGKALAFHLHAGNTTVGCQHGTMAHLRMPSYLTPREEAFGVFPGHIIAEGENHRLALQWFNPRRQVVALGAPRTDHLAAHLSRRPPPILPGSPVSILVALSLHGGVGILRHGAAMLTRIPEVTLLIKPHPYAPNQANLARQFLEERGFTESEGNFTLIDTPVYDLIGSVHAVLFQDTSVGIELAACGVHPLSALPERTENISPLSDLAAFPPQGGTAIPYRFDPVAEITRLCRETRGDAAPIPAFPENFFFANLGNSALAWTEYLEGLVKPPSDLRSHLNPAPPHP
ncbi:MAG: hypothetical protein HQL59_10710 [Magnetococcales bacterium]|nr:hypothetical protein [Magnetococcales bacterium]